jgi:hypothetical protein
MQMMKAAGTMVTLTESEDAAGTYTVNLMSGLADGLDVTQAAGAATESAAYGNTMIEITATDNPGMLWTTQEFVVRRNRKPGVLDTDSVHPAVEAREADDKAAVPTAHVGTVGTHMMATVKGSDLFYDDADDSFTLYSISVDDDEIASASGDGTATLTVMGTKGGMTNIRLKAMDTGGLVSVQHSIQLLVDAGPEADSEKALPDVTSSLSRDAPATGPVYITPLNLGVYFKHEDTANASTESDSDLVYAVTVADASIADVEGTPAGNEPVTFNLKAVGTTMITFKVTEPDNGDTPDQEASRSFMLTVEA